MKNSFHKVTGQPVFFPAQILARIFLLINVLSSVKSPLGIQHEGEKKKTNKQTNKCIPLGSATTFPAFERLIA